MMRRGPAVMVLAMAAFTGTPASAGRPDDIVSIETTGAVPDIDTPAAGAANVAAFAGAYAASRHVSCSSRRTFFVSTPIRLPVSALALAGACTVAAGIGFPDGQPVVAAEGNTGLRVSGLEAIADLARFPGATGFHFSHQTKLVLDDLRATAGFGIIDSGSTATVMTHPVVGDYNRIGIFAVDDTGVAIEGADVHASKSATTVGHCIQIGGLSRYGSVTDGSVHRCGYGFGVSIAGTSTGLATDMTVRGMHTLDTRAEGINFTNVTDFIATDNVETFDGDSTDFGLSVTSDNEFPASSGRGLILGNRIEGSCKAGIALASKVTATAVVDNHLVDTGSCMGRAAFFTASVDARGTMTVTAVASGRLGWFDTVRGLGIPAGATVQPFGTEGTSGTGGVGTYRLSASPPAAVPSATLASRFSDPDHAKFGVLVYGVAHDNVIGPNFVTDRFRPPHLLYAQGELSHAGTPSDNRYFPAAISGVEGGTLIVGRGSASVGIGLDSGKTAR